MTTTVTFNLDIHTCNDSVQDGYHPQELMRILSLLTTQIEQGKEGPFTLYDRNGQHIGSASLEVWADEEA
jgi:hypothetical protein